MTNNCKRLYRVTVRGLSYSVTGVAYNTSYVIAESADSAYNIVKTFLDKNGIGYPKERELDKVELIAENYMYTNTPAVLLFD